MIFRLLCCVFLLFHCLTGSAAAAGLAVTSFANGAPFEQSGASTASVEVQVRDGNGLPVPGAVVSWSIVEVNNFSPAMMPGWNKRATGLAWGPVFPRRNPDELRFDLNESTVSPLTSKEGRTTLELTDIVGERSVRLKARTVLDGKEYSAEQTLFFGNGPLALFRAPERSLVTWFRAYQACNGSPYPDDSSEWDYLSAHVGGESLPTLADLQGVAGASTHNSSPWAYGAAYAAGWPDDWYWTGDARDSDWIYYVDLFDGGYGWDVVGNLGRVACLR